MQVFKEAGLHTPVVGSIIMGAINICGTLLAAALMDRAGRRLLLLLSYAGMGTCLLLIAIASFIPGNHIARYTCRHRVDKLPIDCQLLYETPPVS